jgi:hypothetical protein
MADEDACFRFGLPETRREDREPGTSKVDFRNIDRSKCLDQIGNTPDPKTVVR